MSRRNQFKARLESGQTQVGCFAGLGSASANEVLASHGLDFLLVDMEHGEVDIVGLAGLLRAAEVGGAECLVRVPTLDRMWIKRVLDAGAPSIMVPQIDTVEEAKEAVQAIWYPPQGVRGVARYNRGARFGTIPDYFKTANDEVCLVVQMESEESFNNLADIVAVDGVDAVFIGPSDLAASIGLIGQPGHERVVEMMAEAVKICGGANVPISTLVGTGELAAAGFEKGYSFMAVGTDGGYLGQQVKANLSSLSRWRARKD